MEAFRVLPACEYFGKYLGARRVSMLPRCAVVCRRLHWPMSWCSISISVLRVYRRRRCSTKRWPCGTGGHKWALAETVLPAGADWSRLEQTGTACQCVPGPLTLSCWLRVRGFRNLKSETPRVSACRSYDNGDYILGTYLPPETSL